eukprot:GEMP01073210.1.p1 GENE.GEMP01073210.1~~GEMP01073210.1.p1  ORF type:complete len:316 (-),score=45.90 GEMP01073210.1:238-1185(-)
MIKTKSQAVGFAEDLSSLAEQYVSPVIRAKLDALKNMYPCWRRCRGDGNCYYRAFGFAYVEKLLLQEDTIRISSLLERLEIAKKFMISTDSLEILKEVTTSLSVFYQAIIGDAKKDAALIWCVRALVAQYLAQHASADFNGIPLYVAVDACGFSTVDEFIQNDVLRWGAEAESLVQAMSPFIFDDPVAIRMMQIDSTAETAASYVLRNDNKSADGSGNGAGSVGLQRSRELYSVPVRRGAARPARLRVLGRFMRGLPRRILAKSHGRLFGRADRAVPCLQFPVGVINMRGRNSHYRFYFVRETTKNFIVYIGSSG